MSDAIEVLDEGHPLAFTFEEMLRYSGPGSPGGVALGFKLMERAFPLLDPDSPVERREVSIAAGFRGPGARDACELVTRGLSDGRYVVDPAVERPERGHTLQTYAFDVSYRGRTVSLVLRRGIVTDEFVVLAQKQGRTLSEEDHLTDLKQELADRLTARPAVEVFDLG